MINHTFHLLCLCLLASCSNVDANLDSQKDTSHITIVLSKQNSSHSYRDFIEKADSVSNWRWVNAYDLSVEELELELSIARGIIMTGGVDIHPGRYGSPKDTIKCGTIDLRRDDLETLLLQHVEKSGIPCLGICRGLQFMNVYFGGSLHPNIPDTLSNIHRGSDGHSTEHAIMLGKTIGAIEIDSENIYPTISNHHQGISRLANEMEAWAHAPDGLIEGIRHKDTVAYPFFIGVQWHPERSGDTNSLGLPVGIGFINAVLND